MICSVTLAKHWRWSSTTTKGLSCDIVGTFVVMCLCINTLLSVRIYTRINRYNVYNNNPVFIRMYLVLLDACQIPTEAQTDLTTLPVFQEQHRYTKQIKKC